MFDGPNILLKLHDCTLQDIAIFIFGPFDSKLPIHAPFGGVFECYSDIVVMTGKLYQK